MSVAAVAVLQTIARNEFERDVNSSEDFDWIEGRPWDEPPVDAVTEIVVELEGKSYAFPATAVVEEIKQWEDYYRYEVEEEDDEEPENGLMFNFRSEEEIEEKIWERVHQHFFDQIDTPEEALAAFQARLDYLLKQFEEMVADFNMIGERIPELRPHIEEKLAEVRACVNDTFGRWVEENSPEAD